MKKFSFLFVKGKKKQLVHTFGKDLDEAHDNASQQSIKLGREGWKLTDSFEVPSDSIILESLFPTQMESIFKREYFRKGDIIVSDALPGRAFVFIEAEGFDKTAVVELDPDLEMPQHPEVVVEPYRFTFHPLFNPGNIHSNYS